MEIEKIKDILRDFLDNELQEIKQNKIRFTVLVFFTLFAVGFMFADEDSEQIELNEPIQIEQEKNISTESKQTDTDKKIIVVKKNHDETEKTNVSIVIGENPDDYVYIRDPFASKVEDNIEVTKKPEIIETHVATSENAEKPKVLPTIPDDLPPIPEPNLALLIPQDKPIIPETKVPEDDFILTGTVVSGNNKNALIRKVSPARDDKYHAEDIVVKVGDSIKGNQITDIADGKIILNNGEFQIYISGFESAGIAFDDSDDFKDTVTEDEILSSNSENENLSDIPFENPQKILEENFPNLSDNEVVTGKIPEILLTGDFAEEKFAEEDLISREIIESDFLSADDKNDTNSDKDISFADSTISDGNSDFQTNNTDVTELNPNLSVQQLWQSE